MRVGLIAVALAATATRIGLVKSPELVPHAELSERFDGPALKDRVRGVVGAGHSSGCRPTPLPCTFRAKPGKRALRRARGKVVAA
ncbi:hypothetical protein [Sphingomonas sp.]|uniref:hypothetical protein n=1 Tax=Sphingomonas sp. TaxID=28214 RepID=UPI003BAA39D6